MPHPTLSHPACHPPLHARGCRRDSMPLVPSAWAMPHTRGRATCKGKGCVQGEGEGPGGMHARGRAACKARGRVSKQVGLHMNRRGHTPTHPFHTLCTQ